MAVCCMHIHTGVIVGQQIWPDSFRPAKAVAAAGVSTKLAIYSVEKKGEGERREWLIIIAAVVFANGMALNGRRSGRGN